MDTTEFPTDDRSLYDNFREQSLLSIYFSYVENTEPPKIYHRWAVLTAVGALLGRKIWLEKFNGRLFPNMYTMLMGEPGVRKSTPIKLVKKLIATAGYDTFAANRTSREKFLLDLEGADEDGDGNGDTRGSEKLYNKITASNLWGHDSVLSGPREVFIAADEFNTFAGTGNTDFYTTLGDIWDWDDPEHNYTERVKNSKSVAIYQPTVSLLGGNTPENFTRAFPPELLGHGFLTRMILVYGERTGKLIAFPKPPEEEETELVVGKFRQIFQINLRGVVSKTARAEELLTTIYTTWQDLSDTRLKNYSTRRFDHLLKLCLIIMACNYKEEIDEEVVIEANTILSAVEILMPKALGEFGKSKNSDVTHKIMEFLYASSRAQTPREIFKVVHKDLERQSQLQDILNSLAGAEKIFYVEKKGWLPKRIAAKKPKFVNWEKYLTEEERMML